LAWAQALSLIRLSRFGTDPAPLLRWTLASTVPRAVLLRWVCWWLYRAAAGAVPSTVADQLRLPLPALAVPVTVVIVASIVKFRRWIRIGGCG
jgi:hypothetical protein